MTDDALPRRAFLMTGLISGLTMATEHRASAAIQTGSDGLLVAETHVPVSDGQLPAYLAKPAGIGPFPVVVVIEEIFGVHDYIKDVCRRLAHAGYLAVAPELYARLADLGKMTDPQQIVRDVISKAPDTLLLSDLNETVAWAGRQGGDLSRVGTIGFCRGGRDAWLWAEHGNALKATVAFYGPVASQDSAIQPHNPLELAGRLRCPLLGLYGGQDTSIRESDVRAAQRTARAAGHEVEIVIYPDAPHGFHADYRPSYRPADASDGWKRALAFLNKHGVR